MIGQALQTLLLGSRVKVVEEVDIDKDKKEQYTYDGTIVSVYFWKNLPAYTIVIPSEKDQMFECRKDEELCGPKEGRFVSIHIETLTLR